MTLSLERLKQLVRYEPDTGLFIRLEIGTPGNQRYVGKPTGSFTSKGYRHICLDGKSYRACRLAWFYMTGKWPANQIDHKNTKKWDDRWSNLRLATNSQNQQNIGKRKNNTSGFKRVSYLKRKKPWRAHIGVQGKQIYLGSFFTKEEAVEAYEVAAMKYHGAYGRTLTEYDL